MMRSRLLTPTVFAILAAALVSAPQALADAPAVTGLSPTHGPAAGGTSVTISGTNFTDMTGTVTQVQFGGVNATGFTVDSATQITATAPAGTAGSTVDVVVTKPDPDGASATGPNDRYTYDVPPPPAPSVSGVSPNQGSGAGGTSVTISGTNLTGASAVSFGGTAATTFTVNGATQITATAPGGSGTVDVTVTTAGGTSPASSADRYTYVAAPNVSSLNPTHGPAVGGNSVTIAGNNLTAASAVQFDGINASFNVNNSTHISAVAPPGVGGTSVEVTVTTIGGTSSTAGSGNNYFYDFPPTPAPIVNGLDPTHGPATGGTSVTITGSNFAGATAVRFGSTYAPGFTANGATQITATAPPGTSGDTVNVQVITSAGASSALGTANDYTYDPVLQSAIAPSTFFTHHPKAKTRRRTVSFAFGSDMPGVTFQCLYKQGWADCKSPHVFRHLRPGRYQFQVKAIVNGVEDPTPATFIFKIRR